MFLFTHTLNRAAITDEEKHVTTSAHFSRLRRTTLLSRSLDLLNVDNNRENLPEILV